MSNLYEADSYMVRQKVLKLLGEEFHIYSDESMQQLIGYSKQKALKLKEDIRVYSDEQKSTELICIKARSILTLERDMTSLILRPEKQFVPSKEKV